MSRTQTFQPLPEVTLTLQDTPYRLYPSELMVKSCTIQAHPANTGRVAIGTIAGQNIYLDSGCGATFKGDNMDNGTTAKFDVSTLYAQSSGAGDKVNIIVTEGL